MCRSVAHGGRRCPHADDSNARALRRANARLKAGFKDNVVSVATSHDNASEAVLGRPEVVSGSISASLDNVTRIKGLLNDMMSNGYSWDGTVDGEKFDSYEKAYSSLLSRLEREVNTVGASVVQEVERRTGVTFESIAEYSNSRKEALKAEMDGLINLENKLRQEAAEKFGVGEFLAFDNMRRKAYDNPEDVEAVAFVERIKQFETDSENIRKAYYNFVGNKDPQLVQMWNVNRDMLQEVLKEQRQFGGVELKFDSTSDKRKAAVLQDAVSVYPADWILASNENTASLKVKKTVGRAHYNRNAGQAKIVPSFVFVTKGKDFEPSGSRFESGWVKIEPDEDGLVDYKDEETGTSFHSIVGKDESLWIKPAWEYANQWNVHNGQPRGRGWELATVKEMVVDNETGVGTMKDVSVWRRQVKEKRYVGESKAELLIDSSKGAFVNTEGYDSAVHEFAHRVEDSDVPMLKELQDAFYRRRTEVDGTPMEKVRLYKGKNEFAIPDSFTADYMGKRYEQQKHFELLSTGMEAVFGNNYGGLVGVGGKKPDYDMRNFIVGLLASI